VPLVQRMRQASHHLTWWVGTRFPGAVPLVFVLGYPKSGTTWACQLVADYLQIPFPRFSIFPIGCEAVVHGHEAVTRRYPRGVYCLRDGRDALVSLYFHLARSIPEGDHPILTPAQRRAFPGMRNKADVRANLPAFLEAQFRCPHATRLHWGRHVEAYLDARHPRFPALRYEDLKSDGPRALGAAMAALTGEPADPERARQAVERFSFAAQSRKKPGQAHAKYLRKGETGDWRNHFTRAAAEVFDRYAGDALVRAGYEPDRAWVERCAAEAAAGGASAGGAETPSAGRAVGAGGGMGASA